MKQPAARPGRFRARRPRRALWPWLVLGVAVVALVGVFATHRSASLPPTVGLAVGSPAPALALPATTGGTLSLAQLRGLKVVVLFYEGAT